MVSLGIQKKRSRSRDDSSGRNGNSTRTSAGRYSTTSIVLLLTSHALSFLGGTLYSSSEAFMSNFQPLPAEIQHPERKTTNCPTCACRTCPPCPAANATATIAPAPTAPAPTCPPAPDISVQRQETVSAGATVSLFPETVNKYAVGMSYTTKQEFADKFDPGVPMDEPVTNGDKDVLFLYTTKKSLPNKMKHKNGASSSSMVDYYSVEEATENCNVMNVIFNHRGGERQQCLAIVPNYESFHIMKYMRVPEKGPGDSALPLRAVARGHQWDGLNNFPPPKSDRHTKRFHGLLRTYLNSLDDIMNELKPIAKKIAIQDTIVVMTCNFGQVQLLLNFACAARSRGFDISNVLVFATDMDTKELAEGIGLTAYYNEENFGHLPTGAAMEYGDHTFVLMMMAKIICVHLVSTLGYDLLFQDVDVVWYKNPLEYFHNVDTSFDCYFQDDGARSMRYTPYSANSGFYYIRNNPRTQHFVKSVLMAGDVILETMSHQQALVQVLAEEASLFGLRTKVLSREEDGFPGGFHYHQKKRRYFYDFYKGEKDPWVFHMSWTLNKDNKLLFLRQLGEWYVQDQCIDKNISAIPLQPSENTTENLLVEACCSKEAIFSCHYRDKPSKQPCNDSPPIDKNGAPWWDESFWAKILDTKKNLTRR